MSEETHTPTASVDSDIYDAYFSKCFTSSWKPAEPQEAGWSAALRTCIQRHLDAFNLVSTFHENKPTFAVPSFAEVEEEEDEEDDD